ncbi:MAG: LapA family protein [Sterolibacteriaceae bacterium]|nr:LapA family protein [Sterolibacteriaceae bacterium]
MRLLIWSVRIVFFLLLLAFLSRNSGTVGVQLFFDSLWTLPLSLLMLIFLVAGVLLGVTATTATMLRQRRELARLLARVDKAGREPEPGSSASARSV